MPGVRQYRAMPELRVNRGSPDAAVASSPALLALLDESRIYDQWVARFCSCAS